MAFIKKTVKVGDLRNGDTVEVGGKLETVSRFHIKYNELFGYTYKGDPFLSGITKVVFKVPIAGGGFRYE
jgi:hypothetical protein